MKKRKIKVYCQICEKHMFTAGECGELLYICPFCGTSYMVNFDGKEARLIARLTDTEQVSATK